MGATVSLKNKIIFESEYLVSEPNHSWGKCTWEGVNPSVWYLQQHTES